MPDSTVFTSKHEESNLTSVLSHDAETTLDHTLNIMQELVQWLVKSGIGYTEFTSALKNLFYNEALLELERINQKKTDSSISLLSGLNRRDVSSLRQESGQHKILSITDCSIPISVPARVIGLWISRGLPHRLPITGEEGSFESLVRQISIEKHPHSILLELVRIGLVVEETPFVILQNSTFTPNPKMDETKQLFAANISDHLAAGIHNITQGDDAFLEQAIFADELTQNSIEKLKVLSTQLWDNMSRELLASAIECCERDKGKEHATKRFRLGVFYYEDEDDNYTRHTQSPIKF
ncbi:DUF6502 family protein [Acinetobacter radioresistens]|uniref:DUF6502 family protein n=1 Tax=Acinetobacter radioresistens TaxID=40216 RepID=UPI0009466683|nr:DUF6502 family protein [Acinetobacter radioresistens]